MRLSSSKLIDQEAYKSLSYSWKGLCARKSYLVIYSPTKHEIKRELYCVLGVWTEDATWIPHLCLPSLYLDQHG